MDSNYSTIKPKKFGYRKSDLRVQAVGVLWIELNHVYNIAFRERDTIAEAKHGTNFG